MLVLRSSREGKPRTAVDDLHKADCTQLPLRGSGSVLAAGSRGGHQFRRVAPGSGPTAAARTRSEMSAYCVGVTPRDRRTRSWSSSCTANSLRAFSIISRALCRSSRAAQGGRRFHSRSGLAGL